MRELYNPKFKFMTYGIILAAGSGKRMKTKQKKQFISINGKPILNYSLEKFIKIKDIDVLVLVINNNDKNNIIINNIIKKYNNYITKNKLYIITGGKERYDSVYNAISFIEQVYGINKLDNILIHDSARPNVGITDIKALLKSLKKYKAVTLGYKLSDSIKKIKNNSNPIKEVIKSVNRDEYYLISTPQGFNLKLLYNCYKKYYNDKNNIKIFKNMNTYKITDDLQIIEYYSKNKTYILDSSRLNIKITVQDDLNMIKYML